MTGPYVIPTEMPPEKRVSGDNGETSGSYVPMNGHFRSCQRALGEERPFGIFKESVRGHIDEIASQKALDDKVLAETGLAVEVEGGRAETGECVASGVLIFILPFYGFSSTEFYSLTRKKAPRQRHPQGRPRTRGLS